MTLIEFGTVKIPVISVVLIAVAYTIVLSTIVYVLYTTIRDRKKRIKEIEENSKKSSHPMEVILYILMYNGTNESDIASFIEDHTTGYDCIIDKYDKCSIFKMVALGETISEITVHIGEYVAISNELISVVSKEELDKVIYAEACIKSMSNDEEDTEEKNETMEVKN